MKKALKTNIDIAKPAMSLILIGVLKGYIKNPIGFIVKSKLSFKRFRRKIELDLPNDFIDSAGFIAWLYIRLKKKVGQKEAFEITAFNSAGQSREELFKEAAAITRQFYVGGWILGGFIGLVFGLTLLSLSVFRYQEDYTPNKGTCLSCSRCVDYCPVLPEEKV